MYTCTCKCHMHMHMHMHMYVHGHDVPLASSPVLFLDSPPERGEEKKSLVHIDCTCAGFASVSPGSLG